MEGLSKICVTSLITSTNVIFGSYVLPENIFEAHTRPRIEMERVVTFRLIVCFYHLSRRLDEKQLVQVELQVALTDRLGAV